ncbi:stage III sporulation protein AA [Halobacillus shinanisalinarum]|uniref:Stage III sporulation protein AA n=1 Tax=Halobacillus shinanisalinarum TaxID=2932258 RepID=A0ABY4H053_9BACI|nr:stage III sporulation protein AA [Halobacillus shinanisalinarum]UOQ93709.1 stage III sporulation protein AA [Halobacillus shinanisalinarum]
MKEIIRLFPEHYQPLLLNDVDWTSVQEIRLRVHQRLEVLDSTDVHTLTNVQLSQVDLTHVLNQISQFSLYRLQDEIREGFITIEGGHRVGLAGKANTINHDIDTLKHISFMNIRIARPSVSRAEQFLPHLLMRGEWMNTLIIGPPHSGKTTLLRELSKSIGSGTTLKRASKVALIDERSELAACHQGIPQLDVGERTDVMDACPKAEGVMMMIRSMSPDLILVDELGGEKDAEAVREATFTGVKVICSIHGSSFETVMKRKAANGLIADQIFDRYIVLDRLTPHRPSSIRILNSQGAQITSFEGGVDNGLDRRLNRTNG